MTPVVGETCVETFAYGGEDWGRYDTSDYGCTGYCGAGCQKSWTKGNDCMKHDVCSYYKSLVQGFPASGFGLDLDCGDEAAQTVVSCWEEKWWIDQPVICKDKDRRIYAEIHPAANFLGKQAILDWTGWDREQGMLRPWNYP